MNADPLLLRVLRRRRASVLGLLLSWVAGTSQAVTYYVDASIGRDGASGQRAEMDGADGPLRSLQRVSNILMFPGDQVLFKCGQTFEGPLRIRSSDRAGEGQLKLGSYGPCNGNNRPVITGAHELVGAEALPNGLKRWRVPGTVSQLQFDGVPVPVARHPAQGYHLWPRAGEEFEPAMAIARWLPGRDVAGARAWLRTQDWIMEERRILAGPSGRLDFDRPPEYRLRQGVGLYLTGKPWMIGVTPSWAHDTESGWLTARLPANRGTVTVSMDEPLVQIEGPAALLIQGLHLINAGADALKIHTDAFVTLRDLRIERAARNGVAVAGSRYAVIENNLIQDTGTDGIFFAEAAKVFVRQNTVRRAGMFGPPKSALAAINAHRTERAIIEENLVDHSAYIGIRFSGDAQIRRNIVLRSCRELSDCGAIYTWRRDASHRPPPCDVSHNTVVDVRGDTSVHFAGIPYFFGVYLDNQTRDTTVADNLIADAVQGINVYGIHNKIQRNRLSGISGIPMIVTFDKDKYPASERPGNTVETNDIGTGFDGLRAPADVVVRRGEVTVLEGARQKIAVGWVDWSAVDWAKVAPGCRPARSPLARLSGDVSQQATGVVLECAAKSK